MAIDLSSVDIYAVGMVHLSVCAPESATTSEEISAACNLKHPTGLDHGWSISDEPFRTGEPNGSPCSSAVGRRHWLMVC